MTKKILLVEDDPFLADIYTTKMKEAGFDIQVVEDGGGVIARIKEQKPDLLLLDIVLPHLDGWEVIRQIKESADLKDLRVIILSNLGQKNEVEKGLQMGAVKYLIKAHYTPTEIAEEIKKVLKE
ncbi:MAG: response regulator [Candidatus Nealsonbacteria bacterium]|nr:response regulator [Candidatus Nealsonbacteria bacterium]